MAQASNGVCHLISKREITQGGSFYTPRCGQRSAMPALALAFPLQSFRLAGVQRADVGGTLKRATHSGQFTAWLNRHKEAGTDSCDMLNWSTKSEVPRGNQRIPLLPSSSHHTSAEALRCLKTPHGFCHSLGEESPTKHFHTSLYSL